MATNPLKYYARYDGNGRLIPGSLISTRKKPKVGNWTEIDENGCCVGGTTSISGHWHLSNVYAPPYANGYMIFPDHLGAVASMDPNEVGESTPVHTTMLYINLFDSAGTYHASLANMDGHAGTLTLTQGANSVTYTFTAASFISAGYGNVVFFDWIFGPSTFGSLTATTPSAGLFNAIDAITITITII